MTMEPLAHKLGGVHPSPNAFVHCWPLYHAGQSERKLREVFEAAIEQAKAPGTQPIILFLDELDALCPQRDPTRPHEARVVAQLLTLLDSVSINPGTLDRHLTLLHSASIDQSMVPWLPPSLQKCARHSVVL